MKIYTERELGEALKRVQDYPVPPVVRRYDRLFKWFMREHDLADFEVTKIAYDQRDQIQKEIEGYAADQGFYSDGISYLDERG